MTSDAWAAPRARMPVDATVRIPGSKSLTARALLLSAISDHPTRLRHPLRARDTLLMVDALRALGTQIDDVDGTDWTVTPGSLIGPAEIDCGLAGTVMRFVPPVAALAEGAIHVDGDPRARERPMGPMLEALRELGVSLDDEGRGGLPFTVHGKGRVRGGAVMVNASASSQFVSALLLAGCRYDEGVEVLAAGPVPSLPHIDMTVAMLRRAGIDVDAKHPGRWAVRPGNPRLGDVTIEPDLSNAGVFLAAAAATGGRVRILDWPASTTQPGDHLRAILTAFGADVSLVDGQLTVTGGDRHGVDLDLSAAGELAPVVAALCALADGPSTLRGIGHLRGHETDRLAALSTEINALGGDVEQTSDGLVIRPRSLHGGTVRTYDDHRMAQAAAVIGLVVDDVQVENVATTGKTLPDFVGMWTGMLG